MVAPKTRAGEVVARALEATKLRQTDLAKRMGVSPSYVSQLLTGASPMTAEVTRAIAATLKLSDDTRAHLNRAAAADAGFEIDLDPLPAPAVLQVTIPTDAEIEAARTPDGGWTRNQLAAWGVPWPPPKGWRARLRDGSRSGGR